MKILQVSPYYPPRVGGIPYVVEALSKTLVKAGHKVSVYTSNVPKSKRRENANGVEIFRLFCPLIILNNPVLPGLFSKMLLGERFDVVHIHGYPHLSSNSVTLCRAFRNYPLVLTSHGALLNYKGVKGVCETIYHKSLGKWMLRTVDKVIALSPSQAAILVSLGADPDKIVTIPNGIELDRVNPKADTKAFRDNYGLGKQRVILFAGSLLPRKGVDCLIRAMKYVKTRSLLLVVGGELIGHGGYKQTLERVVEENGLENEVLFVGPLGREELAHAYLTADLFVLPSLAEGLPLVVLEAMAYGKCVIATDIPGNADVIKHGENGSLFQPGNSLELAERIDFLLGNEAELRRLGANARREIEEHYRWETTLERTLAVYKDVQ
jgi:glycosyltransferase involved in cell wall biosynthesis